MKNPGSLLLPLLICTLAGCKKDDIPMYEVNPDTALYITTDIEGEHRRFAVDGVEYYAYANTINAMEPVRWFFKLGDAQNHHKVFEIFIRNHDSQLTFEHLREELYETMDTNEIAFTQDPVDSLQFGSIQVDYYPAGSNDFLSAYSSTYLNNMPLKIVEIKDTVVNDVTQFIVSLAGDISLQQRESTQQIRLQNFRARIVLTSEERSYE